MDDPAALPVFRYHPDPLATGSVKPELDTPCLGCNQLRGYVYTGAVFTEKNFILDDHLCPWCIADGTAAKRFGASFNDTGTTDDIPDAARDEIENRTPGFTAWQQEQWLGCCGDGAAFLGVVGVKELALNFPGAIPAVIKHIEEEYGLEGDDQDEFFASLQKNGQPSAYLFCCLHCQKYLAYVDEA